MLRISLRLGSVLTVKMGTGFACSPELLETRQSDVVEAIAVARSDQDATEPFHMTERHADQLLSSAQSSISTTSLAR